MPAGDLQNMINAQFGSLDGLQKTMGAATVAIQGSGWGWLGKLLAFCYPSSVHRPLLSSLSAGYDKASRSLRIATCANQDPLEATTGLVPLFGIDVWEHAYYLQVML
jgi:superoxide dismutase, Fe-Mn family